MKIINKLSPYTKGYTCWDDCKMSGCPGHKATFEYFNVSDTFKISFRDGEKGIKVHYFDMVEMSLIKDFISRLEE